MTLYIVQAPGTDDAALVRARFIKDGFSWPAFAFAQFWLLYHRLWLALAIWVAIEVAFFALVFPHVATGTAVLIDALAHLFVGIEGNRLRQAKGARAAKVTELVEARDREEAEVTFYRRHAGPYAPETAA